tara:strand:- start:1707 stop:2279 length:573 start_codon:yes stop_codon:yes gene_type:complete
MSDDVPQIPMPEFSEQPVDSTPPPEGGFTRELTPEEERNVLVNFMGSQYGEFHKMDQHIVGESSVLKRGKSNEVKQQITQLLQQPVQPVAPQPLPSQPAPPPPQEVHQPQVQVTEPVKPHYVPPTEPESKDQLTFDFDQSEKDILFDKIEKITTKLDKLHHKVDRIFEVVNGFQKSKATIKKKSVESTKE